MIVSRTKLAVCAARAALEGGGARGALAAFHGAIQSDEPPVSPAGAMSEDEVSAGFLQRLEREADRYEALLADCRDEPAVLRETDAFLQRFSALLRLLRSVSGGVLPCDGLYRLEAEAQALRDGR